jgi:hypothetical protein
MALLDPRSSTKAGFTPDGGFCVRVTNRTGAASVKGTLVEADTANDNSVIVAAVDSLECFGVMYENDVADGSECWVVIGGRTPVLLEDNTSSTAGNWVETSGTTAGRADATAASPPGAAAAHFQEIGHCIEAKTADTDVLAMCIVHFN